MIKILPGTSFEEASTMEWLVTNGIGGFASSTITGANTRRYHGLLTASLAPKMMRQVMVSKIEETIVFGRDSEISFSSNQYPGTVHPNGYHYLRFFERRPLPAMKFEANGFHLLKTVFMPHGSNTTVVEYENTGFQAFKLRLKPLFVARDYHALFHRSNQFDFFVQDKGGYFEMYPHFGSQPIFFKCSSGEWTTDPTWFYNFVYDCETKRGLDDREDAFTPGHSEILLQPGEKAFFIFSTDAAQVKSDPHQLKKAEIERLEKLAQDIENQPFLRDLVTIGDQFIVKRPGSENYTLIAGYHWFTDWGRDTMIAMRGLCIATNRQEEARSILKTFIAHIDGGMLPNRFPDYGQEPEYNTIDATLWLFVVLFEYHQKFGDIEFIKSIFEQLTEILNAHINGARYGIKVTPEGFLSGGSDDAQLTWMDARIDDVVVTPRHGCPVEIQALWYNALRIYQYFAGTLQQPFETYSAWADLLEKNFYTYFAAPDGSLYDVIVPGSSVDDAIRPNQIYAVSLPISLLSKEAEKKVVNTVINLLLTPFGLRTLSTDNPAFREKYEGTPWQRDTAYHQGTVWPFLLSELATAYLKVNNWSKQSLKEVESWIQPLQEHFYREGCIHGIAEIFDGLTPVNGKGAANQAWSVAAALKIQLDLHNSKTSTRKHIPNFSLPKMLIL